jgi:hypothetical protein
MVMLPDSRRVLRFLAEDVGAHVDHILGTMAATRLFKGTVVQSEKAATSISGLEARLGIESPCLLIRTTLDSGQQPSQPSHCGILDLSLTKVCLQSKALGRRLPVNQFQIVFGLSPNSWATFCRVFFVLIAYFRII